MSRTASATLASLRAKLAAADPLRPNVDTMPRAEVVFLLGELAAGAPVFTADDDCEPLTLGTFRTIAWRG